MPSRNPRSVVKWYGRQFKAQLESRITVAAHQIGAYILARVVSMMGPSPSDPGDAPGRDTGSYARSIDYEVGKQSGDTVVRVGSNDKRVLWLELGTGSRSERGGTPYVIEPVNAKALHWKTPKGEDVFTKKVIHPGIHPRPHLRPGVKRSRTFIISALRNLV